MVAPPSDPLRKMTRSFPDDPRRQLKLVVWIFLSFLESNCVNFGTRALSDRHQTDVVARLIGGESVLRGVLAVLAGLVELVSVVLDKF